MASLKKGGALAIERDREDVIEARRAWIDHQQELDVQRLVFIDETGCNAAMARRDAWAPKGARVKLKRPTYASNISLIGAMGVDGVRATMAVVGAVDGEVFKAYVREFLAPTLRPGDIVVMDNLRVHKVQGVRDLIEAAGASVLYQPPYSPDLNPIEQLWGWMKQRLSAIAPRRINRVIDAIGKIIRSLPAEHCGSWFRHCGYQAQGV